ncbi:hypothetical protein [Streptomyces uncialis]|uniref:hypothetical protein n=1 Tax=Streptomyces uncialis TaxID=1048205 RepID=UPI0033FFB1E5
MTDGSWSAVPPGRTDTAVRASVGNDGRTSTKLDPRVRAGISLLTQADEDTVAPGLARLANDLESGSRHTRHAEVLTLDTIDVGYRLIVADS